MANSTIPGPAPPGKTKLKQLIWPDPLIVPPTGPHTHSIILLHGRGSTAARFGPALVSAPTFDGTPLAMYFPGLKFIFPTAKKRRAAAFNRTPINQWFDLFAITDPAARPHLPHDGLRETSAFVHGLIEHEAHLVGISRVAIGGLSQGCAAALHVLLNFQAPSPLLGFIGMSGWLPFAEILGDEREKDHVFGAEDADTDIAQLQLGAANTARDIASLPALTLGENESPSFAHTPVFLGHGTHDEKVPLKLGEQARDVLRTLGCDVEWKEYDEGHWYKVPDQIDDLVAWLRQRMDS
ncbi:acyl-protein thioesterase [Mycena rosella]|uniref:Acyl-protein thioesterase 1 n=1 Tax=Mycena rosella TaxID=1033263 RepID=A0AAD7CZY1_MYCRO|nr:acyl-protein thioesterase [Mycena rosella]